MLYAFKHPVYKMLFKRLVKYLFHVCYNANQGSKGESTLEKLGVSTRSNSHVRCHKEEISASADNGCAKKDGDNLCGGASLEVNQTDVDLGKFGIVGVSVDEERCEIKCLDNSDDIEV